MADIIPAVIPHSYDDVENVAEQVSPFVSWMQIDLTDGDFAGEKSWPFNTGEPLQKFPVIAGLSYEVDLMVFKPEEIIPSCIDAGAKRVIVHLRSLENTEKFVRWFKETFPVVSLVIAVHITDDKKELYPLLEQIDGVQCMGIEKIGFQGQLLDQRVIECIKDIRVHTSFPIGVDGGVTLENAKLLIEAGATRLTAGSAILKSDDIKATIEAFKAV